MRDILINGQKVELPFILERNWQGVKYLVSYDTMNEIDKNSNNFVLIELNDGFVYKMSKNDLEACLEGGEAKIRKMNEVNI